MRKLDFNKPRYEIEYRWKVVDQKGNELERFMQWQAAVRWASENGLTPTELKVLPL